MPQKRPPHFHFARLPFAAAPLVVAFLLVWGPALANAQVGTIYDVVAYGATGNGVSDDTSAVQSAVDAAGAAGGGTVFFPCGQYRLGATGVNRFYSAIQVTHSNITLAGASKYCAELLPRFTHGGVLVAACPAFANDVAYGANRDCDAAPPIDNLIVRDLYFHDDAPDEHCGLYNSLGAPGDCFFEETHGISVWDTTHALIQNNRFDSLGDESITLSSPGTVDSNIFTNTPGIPRSGGAAIVVDGIDTVVTNNVISGTVADPVGDGCRGYECVNSGRGISVETNTGEPSRNVRIEGNHISDFNAWYGITLSSSQADVSYVTIRNNFVDLSAGGTTACFAPERTCDTLKEVGCEQKQRCAFSWSGANGTPLARRDIIVTENRFVGGVNGQATGGVGPVTFEKNLIEGAEGRGMFIAGSPLVIRENLIRGFDEEAIYLSGLNQDDDGTSAVQIIANRIEGRTNDLTPHDSVSSFLPTGTECGSDGIVPGGIRIADNQIVGSGSPESIRRAVSFAPCTEYLAQNNVIDFNGSAEPNSIGFSDPKYAYSNRILCPGGYGIYTRLNDAEVIFNAIDMCGEGSRGVQGLNGLRMQVSGNLILDSTFRGADVSGLQPTCTDNTSRNTISTVDRAFTCGTDGAGQGCVADAFAGGFCDTNQVCNASDPGCTTAIDTDNDNLLDLDELLNGSHPLIADTDYDGVRDDQDNCVGIYNIDQTDSSGNGFGDACDFLAIPEPGFPLGLWSALAFLTALCARSRRVASV